MIWNYPAIQMNFVLTVTSSGLLKKKAVAFFNKILEQTKFVSIFH